MTPAARARRRRLILYGHSDRAAAISSSLTGPCVCSSSADAMQTLPRWARVVRVGRRPFGMVSVDVEIHYGRTPPHVESVLVSVPRGAQLQVGQDMFVVGPDTSSDSNHTSWVLDVTRPPQYGSWPTPPEFLSCQASTTRPSGGQSAGHRKRAAVLRRRVRFLPGSGRRAVSPGGAGRGSPRPGRSRPP